MRSSPSRLLLIGFCAYGATSGTPRRGQLHAAVAKEDVEKLGTLLDDGVDINEPDSNGYTPLFMAAMGGHLNIVKFLLARKADASIGEHNGYTPIHVAAHMGRPGVVQALLAHGLDANDYHSDGYTPMHRACWGQKPHHTETVKVFLEAGVPFNQPARRDEKGHAGITPLAMAKRIETCVCVSA